MRSLNYVSRGAGLTVLVLFLLPFAYAQRGPGPGQRARMYNPANETTVNGTVEEVKTVTGRHGWNGTHLILKVGNNMTDVQERVQEGKIVSETRKTEEKNVDVHLGPASFLKEKDFSFSKGDRVQITGARAEFGGTETIIAREVKKNGGTLTLRDAQGIPAWPRGRRR